ncbi:9357_t:CDS:2 [Diversispora eburnea]|uniref:9357_t:CDS:1 n=1 Tax=Diversispora eburnea TaxID=1213867 RepID=A0A9N8YJB9_9GLOM|nr:9357_t:CDS:2 [Diversispora eburnea]
MNNASVEFIDNLSQTASCYGLPYGIFGIVCWVITFSGTALTYANFPLFSPWQWGKDYKPQDPLLLVIIGGMVIGPTCYTCASCRAEWELILIALGQLSPFALKIISDGFVGEKKSYRTFGMILMVPLSILGWVGTTRLYIHLMHTTKVIPWIWIIYTVAITALVVAGWPDIINCFLCWKTSAISRFSILIRLKFW